MSVDAREHQLDNGTQPTVEHIHVALATKLPMRAVASVHAEAGAGLVGDRYHGSRHRHVTVQAATDLAESAAMLGEAIEPGDTRRNITISHGPVPSRPGTRFSIGPVELEVVRIAAPCKLMDDLIAPGAKDALRRRAGSVCRVITSGEIAVGAPVELPDS